MTPLSDGSVPEPGPAAPDGVPRARLSDAGRAAGPVEPSEPLGSSVEPLEDPEEPPQLALVEEEPRRYPSTIGGSVYLIVLAATVLGLVVASLGHWRGGVHILADALLAAAAARAFLRRRDSGMLEVRSRWFDVALLCAVGVALWVLASTIPAQG